MTVAAAQERAFPALDGLRGLMKEELANDVRIESEYGVEEAEDVLANIIGKELYDALVGDLRKNS